MILFPPSCELYSSQFLWKQNKIPRNLLFSKRANHVTRHTRRLWKTWQPRLGAQGFQPANPAFLDIKNLVLTTLKVNQYSGKDDEDRNIHLTDFLEACGTINQKDSQSLINDLGCLDTHWRDVQRIDWTHFQAEA